MDATDTQIAEWGSSSRMDHQIAAVIATWARGKERGTVLPSNDELACELDFAASASSYRQAKRFLASQGVLSSNDGPYCVG
jgi:hypothetical protein